jgi:hypothetical protein
MSETPATNSERNGMLRDLAERVDARYKPTEKNIDDREKAEITSLLHTLNADFSNPAVSRFPEEDRSLRQQAFVQAVLEVATEYEEKGISAERIYSWISYENIDPSPQEEFQTPQIDWSREFQNPNFLEDIIRKDPHYAQILLRDTFQRGLSRGLGAEQMFVLQIFSIKNFELIKTSLQNPEEIFVLAAKLNPYTALWQSNNFAGTPLNVRISKSKFHFIWKVTESRETSQTFFMIQQLLYFPSEL